MRKLSLLMCVIAIGFGAYAVWSSSHIENNKIQEYSDGVEFTSCRVTRLMDSFVNADVTRPNGSHASIVASISSSTTTPLRVGDTCIVLKNIFWEDYKKTMKLFVVVPVQ